MWSGAHIVNCVRHPVAVRVPDDSSVGENDRTTGATGFQAMERGAGLSRPRMR